MSDPARTEGSKTARPTDQPQTHRSAGQGATTRGLSGRGVTGRGVVVLVAVGTLVAGLFDLAISGHRGHLFGIVFAVASGVGALVVRRRDLPTSMIAPPLLYCVLIALMSLVDPQGGTGSLFTREGLYLTTAFVTGAPAIWIGTAAACLVGWYRLRR